MSGLMSADTTQDVGSEGSVLSMSVLYVCN